MDQFPDKNTRLAFTLGVPLLCLASFLLLTWVYVNVALRMSQAQGVYASPEAGMLAVIDQIYADPYEAEFPYGETYSFDGSDTQHIWYVIVCVWGNQRKDGSPVGSESHAYDLPGSFFLNTKDGWVFMPEGAFPNFISFWMKVYGLAGSGSTRPTQPLKSEGRCVL